MFKHGRAWSDRSFSGKNSQEVKCIAGVGGGDLMQAVAEVIRCDREPLKDQRHSKTFLACEGTELYLALSILFRTPETPPCELLTLLVGPSFHRFPFTYDLSLNSILAIVWAFVYNMNVLLSMQCSD